MWRRKIVQIPVLASAFVLADKQYRQATRRQQFEQQMKLVFPNYTLPENGKYANCGQVVSKTQLEFVIQQCNQAGTSMKIMRDADLNILKNIKSNQFQTDILLDISKLSQIMQVDQGSKQATVQTGISIKQLTEDLKRHGLVLGCLPSTQNEDLSQISLNQVLADDALCIESYSKGSFRQNASVERVSFFTGDAQAVHGGGYSTGAEPSTQYGIDLSNLIFGTRNNFGVPYEVVLNVKPRHIVPDRFVYNSRHVHGFEQMADELADLSKDFDNSLQNYDAFILRKPMGQDVKELIKLKAVPTKTQVNRKTAESPEGYQAKYEDAPAQQKYVKMDGELLEEQLILDQEGVLKRLRAAPIVRLVDGFGCTQTKEDKLGEFLNVRLTAPANMKLRIILAELVEFLNQESYTDVGLEIQIMKNKALRIDLQLKLGEKNEQREDTLQRLDALTSHVITYGGAITAPDSATLNQISPHLAERMAGRQAYELQMKLKESFDPANCMNRDEFVNLSERQSEGVIQKMLNHNKQFNYLVNVFGAGK